MISTALRFDYVMVLGRLDGIQLYVVNDLGVVGHEGQCQVGGGGGREGGTNGGHDHNLL